MTTRTNFWPGFALGFALLALTSCGGIAAALGFTRLTLADLQGGDPAWSPPPITPTAVVTPLPAAALAAVSARFSAGQTVRNGTNSRVNIRATPGYLGKPPTDVVGQLASGDTLVVLGESALADNLIWWRIRFVAPDGVAVEGWVAEATASGVQILSE